MTIPAFVAAAHARDEAALRATLAPTFTGLANGRPIDAEGQVAILRGFWTGFPEGTLAMEAVGGHGRYVITWKVAGPHSGDYLGIPATGRPVEISGFITARSDAAGIQEMSWKWDTKTFVKSVLGPELVLPPAPPTPKRHLVAPWEEGQRGPQRHHQKGKGQRQGGGQQRPRGPAPEGGAPSGAPGVEGEVKSEGQGRQRGNRRKGPRQPRPDGQAPSESAGEQPANPSSTPTAESNPPPAREAAPEPKPEATDAPSSQ